MSSASSFRCRIDSRRLPFSISNRSASKRGWAQHVEEELERLAEYGSDAPKAGPCLSVATVARKTGCEKLYLLVEILWTRARSAAGSNQPAGQPSEPNLVGRFQIASLPKSYSEIDEREGGILRDIDEDTVRKTMSITIALRNVELELVENELLGSSGNRARFRSRTRLSGGEGRRGEQDNQDRTQAHCPPPCPFASLPASSSMRSWSICSSKGNTF